MREKQVGGAKRITGGKKKQQKGTKGGVGKGTSSNEKLEEKKEMKKTKKKGLNIKNKNGGSTVRRKESQTAAKAKGTTGQESTVRSQNKRRRMTGPVFPHCQRGPQHDITHDRLVVVLI